MKAHGIKTSANGLALGQLRIRVAFLSDQLPTHFHDRESGVEPLIAELRIGLTLAVDDGADVLAQRRKSGFGRFASAQILRCHARHAAVEFMESFAHRYP
jgi:hypothetical protein